MSKVLIVYPHGLGDCILATPAIREYKKQTGNFIGFATLERFRSAELFKNNPYVDEVIYTKDAWNDFPSFEEGIGEVVECCQDYAKDNKYDKVVYVNHSPTGSKIADCCEALDVYPTDLHTEVYLTDEDHEWAYNHPTNGGAFIHSDTGVDGKNLPKGYGKKYVKDMLDSFGITETYEDVPIYEVKKNVTPITKAFALLKQARIIIVADSVYYHAAGAMDKDVDLAYFARGKSVYDRVKPLHPVKQNIVYELEPV